MKFIIATLVALSFNSAFATTATDVSNKTKEAASAAADYTVEQKEAFQKDMDAKLTTLKSEIALLKKQASEKTGEAKKSMNEKIAAMEQKQAEMKADLAKLKKSSGAAWSQMKSGMSKAWDSLSDSYTKAKAEF
ncbi:hypothetical protein [Bdellovibrio sp. HCB2-146]|uniref:hypothetical protein n=1 Tax=Bdellovibrio sp. HCB2-146 TaxID=3394362 RepID=UPI0039BC8A73